MPYRAKSTDVWFNMPGVVAAYQPVACPGGPLLARVNVSNEQRTPGRYAAAPGVAPSFDPRVGQIYNGSTQYLDTGVVPASDQSWSMIAAFAATTNNRAIAGYINASATSRMELSSWTDETAFWSNGTTYKFAGAAFTDGTMAVAGRQCYANGSLVTTLAAGTGGTPLPIYIGARRLDTSANWFFSGNLRAFMVCARTLAPAEVWYASRQMAYCDRNPDWSAWGRRRRYYYAPSAAGFQAAWAARANRLLGGGADRV